MAAQGTSAVFGSSASRLYHCLMSGCGLLAAVLFGAMGLLVCADIAVRNLAGGTIAWSVEVTEYMLMAATFIAAPWLLYLGDHIRIDIALRALPDAPRRALEALTDVVGLAISAVLAWQCLAVTQDAAAQGGMVFKVLVFAEWWLNLPMLFAAVLLSVEFARRLLRRARPRVER
ncbi:MAG TPA: TRAP transporter small permease [Rhodocyclaceae bacterium]|nr:TRAP transporter small permease [Rhodocyclaceae bacterium]